jgi:hypothetical protein
MPSHYEISMEIGWQSQSLMILRSQLNFDGQASNLRISISGERGWIAWFPGER